jgi:hypothetical protein
MLEVGEEGGGEIKNAVQLAFVDSSPDISESVPLNIPITFVLSATFTSEELAQAAFRLVAHVTPNDPALWLHDGTVIGDVLEIEFESNLILTVNQPTTRIQTLRAQNMQNPTDATVEWRIESTNLDPAIQGSSEVLEVTYS